MLLSGQHANPASRAHQGGLAFNFHQHFPAENVKELLRLLVVMSKFSGPRRHYFFDDAELIMIDQVPGIAVRAPAIMLGIFAADYANL